MQCAPAPRPPVAAEVPLEGGGYTMNHTCGVFLFDATGRLVATIDSHEPRRFAPSPRSAALCSGPPPARHEDIARRTP